MPPKGTQAAQKTSKKNDKKSSVPEVNLDDFFTRFLAKKRRNLNKKLTKIETYEKTPADKLQPDHKEILASKPDTLEKLTYFDTIGKLYIEAYLAKDEDDEGVPAQSQSPQRQEEHRAPAPQAAAPAFNHEENNTRIAASLAQLLTAGSYFAHTHQRENFNKLHGAALSKKYGSNFLEGLGNLWRTLTEQTDAENSVRAEEVAKIIENFLNNSALISPATNTTYQRLQEAIRELGSHQGFQTAIHGAHSKTATHHAPATHHEEVHEPQSEVKAQISLVKSSRKNSKRSRLQSEVETEAVHHHETHAETAKPSKPAKEVDPDAPAEDDTQTYKHSETYIHRHTEHYMVKYTEHSYTQRYKHTNTHCILYNTHCTLYNTHCIVYNRHSCTLHTILNTQYTEPMCTVCMSVQHSALLYTV